MSGTISIVPPFKTAFKFRIMTHTAIEEILQSRSIIITDARVDVLAFLLKTDKKLSSLNEISKIGNNKFNRITIYRTLVILCEAKLIYKIEVNNHPFYGISALVDLPGGKPVRPSSEFCHFQCEGCQSVFSFPFSLKDVKLPSGLKKTGVRLFLTGYCSACSSNAMNHSDKKK